MAAVCTEESSVRASYFNNRILIADRNSVV